jgi:MarR family transcriptional regulator, organic hydroperoxide resistance regulator
MAIDKKLEDVVYYRIERVMRQVKVYTRQVIKQQEFGVTIDQWLILKRISESPEGLTQIELSNGIFKDPAAVTRILNALEKMALVSREVSPGDRRSFQLHLTPQGKTLVSQMTPTVQDIRAKGLQHLSEEEIEQLKKLLDKMYFNFEP